MRSVARLVRVASPIRRSNWRSKGLYSGLLVTIHYMDEVEYLCGAFESAQPGHIGIMDSSKLISLGTLQQLRSAHGEGLVMKQLGVTDGSNDSVRRWEYLFFPSLDEANTYLNQQPDKTGMMVRPSNLEDIFVELTQKTARLI